MDEAAFERFMRDKVRSTKTIAAYLFDIRHFTGTNPKYLTYSYEDVIAAIASINEQYRGADGRVSTSVSRKVIAIKWLYHFLIATGKRGDHPLPTNFGVKGTKKKGMVFSDLFTPAELEQLHMYLQQETPRFPATHQRNQVVISLLIYQALACDELLRLEVSDIDLEAGTIDVPKTLQNQERILSLHPSQYMLLHAYLEEGRKRLLKEHKGAYADTSRLIVTMRSYSMGTDTIASIMKKYKLLLPAKQLTAENIRKSVIYNWLNVQKKPFEHVQYWAGHRWPSSTERYRNRIDFEDGEMLDKLHPIETL